MPLEFKKELDRSARQDRKPEATRNRGRVVLSAAHPALCWLLARPTCFIGFGCGQCASALEG